MRCRYKGKRNAGIAGGRLYENAFSGYDLARGFQGLDHGDADTILHTCDRIEKLQLGEKIGMHALFPCQLVEAHDRSVADRLRYRIEDPATARHATGLIGVFSGASLVLLCILMAEQTAYGVHACSPDLDR